MKILLVPLIFILSFYSINCKVNENSEIQSFSSIDINFGLASIVNDSPDYVSRGFSSSISYSNISKIFMFSGKLDIMSFSGNETTFYLGGNEYNTDAIHLSLGAYFKFLDNYNFDLITPYAGLELGYMLSFFNKSREEQPDLLPFVRQSFITISPVLGVSIPLSYSFASFFELRYRYLPGELNYPSNVSTNFPKQFNIMNITAGMRFAL